jgi:hypothetical protein
VVDLAEPALNERLDHGGLVREVGVDRVRGLWVPRTVTRPLIGSFGASRPTSQSPSIARAA